MPTVPLGQAPVCTSAGAPNFSPGNGFCPHPSKRRLSRACFFLGSLSSHLTERASPQYLPGGARSTLKGGPRENRGTGTHRVTWVLPRPAGNSQDVDPAFRTFQLRSFRHTSSWVLSGFRFGLIFFLSWEADTAAAERAGPQARARVASPRCGLGAPFSSVSSLPRRVQKEQLAAIFKLMKDNKETFGEMSAGDVQEQLRLYDM